MTQESHVVIRKLFKNKFAQQDILRLDRVRVKLEQLKVDTQRSQNNGYKYITLKKVNIGGNKEKRTLVPTKQNKYAPYSPKKIKLKNTNINFKPVRPLPGQNAQQLLQIPASYTRTYSQKIPALQREGKASQDYRGYRQHY